MCLFLTLYLIFLFLEAYFACFLIYFLNFRKYVTFLSVLMAMPFKHASLPSALETCLLQGCKRLIYCSNLVKKENWTSGVLRFYQQWVEQPKIVPFLLSATITKE